jgi:hypothetical protein
MDICRTTRPGYREHAPGHFAACHLLTTPVEINDGIRAEHNKTVIQQGEDA